MYQLSNMRSSPLAQINVRDKKKKNRFGVLKASVASVFNVLFNHAALKRSLVFISSLFWFRET